MDISGTEIRSRLKHDVQGGWRKSTRLFNASASKSRRGVVLTPSTCGVN